MSSSSPQSGKECIVQVDGVQVAYGTDFTLGVSVGLMEEYAFTDSEPAILAAGNKSYDFTIAALWVPNTPLSAKVTARTAVTVIFRPEGTGAGKKQYQLASAILTKWNLKTKENAIVLHDVVGKGKTYTETTQV